MRKPTAEELSRISGIVSELNAAELAKTRIVNMMIDQRSFAMGRPYMLAHMRPHLITAKDIA